MNRNLQKELKNKEMQQALQDKIGSTVQLMLNIPTNCGDCNCQFDKNDKTMRDTWIVQVFNEEKKVLLHCPECYEKITKGE